MVPFSKNSWPNGLEFLFDVESFDYALSSSGSEGLVLSVIYHLDIPIMKNIGINVQPGEMRTSVAMMAILKLYYAKWGVGGGG